MEGQEQQQVDIYALVDAYKDLLDTKEELKELTTENNKAIMAARDALAKAMIDAESPRISRNGFMYSLGKKVEYSKRGCPEEEFFKFLRDNGLGDIIKETVNARTLNSAMKESVEMLKEEYEAEAAEENGGEAPDIPSDWLPKDYKPYISAYAFYDVSKRQETNKTAKKAKGKQT